jgi:amidohydrolase
MLETKVKELAVRISSDVISNRRYLHSHPELSFKEYGTAAFIKTLLTELEIPWKPLADTGILAIVQGEKPSSRVIALRADMDALPVTEENEVDYASLNKGVMHACGHDAHSASLLGVARILQTLKPDFGGTVKLIFQPGEEVLPGGASFMIRDGVLKDPIPQAVIGQHVMPSISCGKIGIRKGKYMASMDELSAIITGKGGHGAQPHLNTDPVVIASHIIVALQQVVSRMANPHMPSVLSFGKFIANGAYNVIPNQVYVEGTFRTLDEAWRSEAHDRIRKMAIAIAESMGGHCEFRIVKGYPFLINEEKLTAQVSEYASHYLGPENVLDLDIWMAAEDFAYYSQVADSCFYMLGTGNRERGITASLHTPTFDIDENALTVSTGLMAYIALKRLGN